MIHRFLGQDGSWDWEGVPLVDYGSAHPGVTVRRFVSHREGAHNFEMRYFELQPGSCTQLDQHVHDHGVLVLRGRGTVRLGDNSHPIQFGDAVYIPSNQVHQLQALAGEVFGFLCVVLDERLRHESWVPDQS